MALASAEGQTVTETVSFGCCTFGGCDCKQYTSPISKWSKDKCKRCDHWRNKHETSSVNIQKENTAVAIQPHSESFLQSKKFIITNGGKTMRYKKRYTYPGATSYGSQLISFDDKRKYIWTFYIHKMGFNHTNISIGITDAQMQFVNDGYGFSNKGAYCLCDTGVVRSIGKYLKGGAPFVEKDFVSMKFNVSKRLLSFSVNGKEAKRCIDIKCNPQTKYRMAVAMQSNSSVTVTDFIIDDLDDVNAADDDNNEPISMEGFSGNNDDAKQSHDEIIRQLTEAIVALKQENVKLRQRIHELESEKESSKESQPFARYAAYAQWNEDGVLSWIFSVENGVLLKYQQQLIHNVRKLEMKGSDLLKMDRLDIEQIGVTKFADQKLLQQSIEKLKCIANNNNNKGADGSHVTYM